MKTQTESLKTNDFSSYEEYRRIYFPKATAENKQQNEKTINEGVLFARTSLKKMKELLVD